jgi:Flp pilus assembly protein TadD
LRHQVPKAAQKAYDKGLGTKDMQKSARNLERAIALDPEFGAAHCDLGFAYTRLGLLSQAAAEFRRAIELMPEESIPYSNLAWLLFATGQRAEALANLQRALRLSPENGSARILAREMMESAR